MLVFIFIGFVGVSDYFFRQSGEEGGGFGGMGIAGIKDLEIEGECADLRDVLVQLRDFDGAPEAAGGGFHLRAVEEGGEEIEMEGVVVELVAERTNERVFGPARIVFFELKKFGKGGFGEDEFGLDEGAGIGGGFGEFFGIFDGFGGASERDESLETTFDGFALEDFVGIALFDFAINGEGEIFLGGDIGFEQQTGVGEANRAGEGACDREQGATLVPKLGEAGEIVFVYPSEGGEEGLAICQHDFLDLGVAYGDGAGGLSGTQGNCEAQSTGVASDYAARLGGAVAADDGVECRNGKSEGEGEKEDEIFFHVPTSNLARCSRAWRVSANSASSSRSSISR